MISLKKVYFITLLLHIHYTAPTAPNTFIAFITGFDGPYAIAITPNGLRAYVTDGTTVRVIDTNDASPTFNTLIATPNLVGVFNGPNSIAITPDSKYAYVVNNVDNSVLIIDTTTNSLVSAPDLMGAFNSPASIAITPNGLYAYVPNAGNNSVNVIRLADNTVLTTPDLDGILTSPFDIGILPNGHYGYITNLTGNVNVINTNPASPNFNKPVSAPGLASVNAQPEGFGITPYRLFAYVSDGSAANVSALDVNPSSPTFNTVISAPNLATAFNAPNDAASTPDGDYTYVTNFLGASGSISSVSVIDTNPASPTYNSTLNTPGLVAPAPTTRYFTLAATPNARYVYAVDGFNNNVSVIYTGIITPPLNFSGCTLVNRFLLQKEYVNRLTWSAPTLGIIPAAYKIYRDAALTQLVATVPASPRMVYYDHNRLSSGNTYYIVSVDELGNASAATSTTVTAFC